MGAIRFFSEKVRFKLPRPTKTSNWLKKAIQNEGFQLNSLNIIFCSDVHLGKINQHYLNHKTLTDIITFDNSLEQGSIEGDIFISIPRVRENATKFQVTFDSELHRVMVHGVLHLLGYNDKSKHQKTIMRKKEDAYLSLLVN